MKENALVVIKNLDASLVFTVNGMTKLLKDIETKATSHVPELTTEQGRKDIVSLAYKVTRSKTLIDDLGKNVVAEWKKKAKGIDIHRKIAREFLDDLKDKVRQPLTVWEKEQAKKKIEEERLEKIKINERVDALFKVNVNIPYFDAAMLSDDEFFTMLDEATNKYNIERLRLQKEQKAKEEEEERLADEKAAQEAEAKRLADIQVAQEKKEAELKAQAKAIEDAKKAETERKNREAFEKKAKEDAKEKAEKERREQREKTEKSRTKLLSAVDFSVDKHDLGTMPDDQFDRMYSKAKAKWDKKQAKLLAEKLEKERIEAEEKRIAKEKVDREAKEQEIKEARFESLKEIGFKYPFNDLGTMPEKQYCELYDSHRKVWDAEQQAIFIEKLKKERLEKEKAEAAEKARIEALRPDKERIINYATTILDLPLPEITSEEGKKVLAYAIKVIGLEANEIIKQAEEL